MGCSQSSPKREVYNNTILPQETGRTLKRQPNFTPKTTREREQKNPKISGKKEIIKKWAGINEKEIKETVVMINKTKTWSFEKINKIAFSQTHQEKRGESNQQN